MGVDKSEKISSTAGGPFPNLNTHDIECRIGSKTSRNVGENVSKMAEGTDGVIDVSLQWTIAARAA